MNTTASSDSADSANPVFSIVIPTYNGAATIAKTIEACLAQTFTDFEVLIVDDGSEDDTKNAVTAFTDQRIRYIHQQNGGPAAARNTGVDAASGQLIAYLDADDSWYPDYLEHVFALIQSSGSEFVYGQIIVDRGVGRYWVKPDRAIQPDESIFDYLYIHGGFIQTSTMVVSSALASKVRWDESVTFGDNDQYAIDLVLAGNHPVMMDVPGTLYEDIMNPNALSQLPIHGGLSSKHTNFFQWMAGQKDNMSAQAWLGYRAKFETGSVSMKERISMLSEARSAGAISSKGFVRLLLQHTFPRFYRRLTDKFVALRGKPLEAVRS